MPMYPPFWRPFFFLQKMATIFNVMRLIFETMRQRNVTVVSTHIIYGQHNSDSALLRASHNKIKIIVGTIWLAVVAICSK